MAKLEGWPREHTTVVTSRESKPPANLFYSVNGAWALSDLFLSSLDANTKTKEGQVTSDAATRQA